jgi:hypothetical protein
METEDESGLVADDYHDVADDFYDSTHGQEYHANENSDTESISSEVETQAMVTYFHHLTTAQAVDDHSEDDFDVEEGSTSGDASDIWLIHDYQFAAQFLNFYDVEPSY